MTTTPSAGRQPTSCLQLAQEGERHCREGNFIKGIEFLQQSISVGTADTNTLSAIYSQLGNAYFTMRDFDRALEYHMHDVHLTRFVNDSMGMLKAAANVGHTHKAFRNYTSALLWMKVQQKLASKLDPGTDKMVAEARAFYNLATIYQLRSRSTQKLNAEAAETISMMEEDDCSAGEGYMDDLRACIDNYKQSLLLSEALQDMVQCGRTYGCLGNAYYVLREYPTAIDFHYKRLDTARQFGDKDAMRRAYTSLANAHVFLPDMDKAIEFYRLALTMAQEMGDSLAEAQSCFSLANAASLLADHHTALEYHQKHLHLARLLEDRAGESRAYQSLAADLRSIGDYPKAIYFLALRRRAAREMHDDSQVDASTEGMRQLLRDAPASIHDDNGEIRVDATLLLEANSPPVRLSRSLRSLHEEEAGDCGLSRIGLHTASDGDMATTGRERAEEDLFDMLERMQGKRLDEQRADPPVLTDLTNRRAAGRQTDTLLLSPSVSSLSSHNSRRRRLSLVNPFKKRQPGHSTSALPSMLSSPSSVDTTNDVAATQSSPTPSSNKSFVSLPLFKVPRFPSRRGPSSKKLASSSSLPEESARRHSLFARPVTEPRTSTTITTNGPEAMMEMIMAAQGRRMEEQRAPFPGLTDQDLLQKYKSEPLSRGGKDRGEIDDCLYELVLRGAQRGRIDDQRSELGGRRASESTAQDVARRPMTIPEDDITELVARMQMGRMDEQRASLGAEPSSPQANGTTPKGVPTPSS